MIRRIALVALLALLIGAGVLSQGVAQDSDPLAGWSPARLLGSGWWQNLTVDQQGNLHVSWYGVIQRGNSTALDEDLMMYMQLPLGGEWSEARDVLYTGTGGYTVRNALAATSNGELFAVFRAQSLHRMARAPIVAATDSHQWRDMGALNDSSYYVDMLASRNDVLHIVYSAATLRTDIDQVSLEMNPCALCGDPQYTRSADGGATWSFPEPLSVTPTGGSDKLRLFEGGSGRLYLTWDEGTDWYSGRGEATDVRFVYSDDEGLTWSDPVILTGPEDSDYAPFQFTMTELRDGNLLAIWRFATRLENRYFFQVSEDVGLTWTNPAPIPGIFSRAYEQSGLDNPTLVTDEIGNAHLFVVGYTEGNSTRRNPGLYQLVYQQGIWTPARRIFYSPNERPEWPQARVGARNDLHLTWFTRDRRENSPPGAYAGRRETLLVYYSHNENIPILRPTEAFLPTHTPLPTSTPVVNLDPTMTPFPTVDPNFSNAIVRNQDQYAQEALVLALAAVGLICAGVLFISRIGR
jgi:hypothetical protein